MSALAVSETPADRLYYATSTGNVYRIDGANAGQPARSTITGTSFPSGAYINCIAVDSLNADRLMAVFSNYGVLSLWYSSNGGSSWTSVGGNLEQNADGSGNGPTVNWATIVTYGGTTYYFAATSTGLYSTTLLNGASTVWVQEGASTIGKVVVDMVVSRGLDGLVAAATHANGIYSATIVTGVELAGEIPSSLTAFRTG